MKPSRAILLIFLALLACGRRDEQPATTATTTATAASDEQVEVKLVERLPKSAARIRWTPPELPSVLPAGSTTKVRVTFTNISDTTWPDKAMADPTRSSGQHAVRLGYSWTPIDQSKRGPRVPVRGDLSAPVAPGQTTTVEIPVKAPDQPGEYKLTFELVQELLFWFTDLGASAHEVRVRVGPAS